MTQAPPTMQIPATVQAVLAARIDRLPLEEKRLLQTAAVMGTEVPVGLLQAVMDLPEGAIRLGLTHLQDAEFLYEASLFPELVYTFKHALTQEVAYGSLLHGQRRTPARDCRGHRGAVRRSPGRAGRTPGVSRPAGGGPGQGPGAQAGREKAMARSAYREAVGFLSRHSVPSRSCQRRGTREQAIDLRLALYHVLAVSGDLGRGFVHLREAEALAAARNDHRRLGQVFVFLSFYFFLMGAYDQTIAAAQRALALATAGGEVGLHEVANQYLGLAYLAQGDYRRAIDCPGQAVASLEGHGAYERFGQVILPAVVCSAWLAWGHAERHIR